MVFQSYALFPHMTVGQNIEFALHARKVPRGDRRGIAERSLDLVQLPEMYGRPITSLSGGQQQRVALARALAPNPSVLLLDEPLAALDKQLRELMQVEIKRIQREVGVTTVAVTHDQTEAMTMSDRVAIMRDGEIEQLDTPEELYRRPTTVVRRALPGRGQPAARGGGQARRLRRAGVGARGHRRRAPRGARAGGDRRAGCRAPERAGHHRELPGHALPDRVPAPGVRHDRRDAAARHPARAHRAGIDAGARAIRRRARARPRRVAAARRAPRRSSRPPSARWSRRSSGRSPPPTSA